MITGNALLRSDDGSMGTGGNQLNWMCHDGHDNPRATGFPKFTNCDDTGLAATIRFPSCWNGQDFNPAAPQAHMAFPINQDGMKGCLAPFNVKRFPEIMIEYWVDVKQFTGDYGINDKPFVLAPGDNTGYAFHADFINGWEPGVLGKAMKTCRVGNTGLALDTPDCFGANSLYTNQQKDACANSVPNTVPEDNGSGTWLKALPGCNPIQSGPANAVPVKDCTKVNTGGGGNSGSSSAVQATTVATSASSKTVATQTSATTSPSETSTSGGSTSGGAGSVTAADGSIWTPDGCYVDTLNPRSLGSNGWWGNPITNIECAKGCSKNGFSISGAENGGQCFCGNSLIGSKKVASSDCNSKCAGDPSQLCGGPARLSVYRKSGSSSKQARAHRHLVRHRQAVS
ncbi:hypothetical protein G7Y79_00001g001590 [Physcia stellaris]|nr:hypothetical protein G7Y79_00001g001590 [Physcia stellaris]